MTLLDLSFRSHRTKLYLGGMSLLVYVVYPAISMDVRFVFGMRRELLNLFGPA
jgi:hypothetical protein